MTKVKAEMIIGNVFTYWAAIYLDNIDGAIYGNLATRNFHHRRSAKRAAERIAKKLNLKLEWEEK